MFPPAFARPERSAPCAGQDKKPCHPSCQEGACGEPHFHTGQHPTAGLHAPDFPETVQCPDRKRGVEMEKAGMIAMEELTSECGNPQPCRISVIALGK